MEENGLLSPIPRHSQFEFPWSSHLLDNTPGSTTPRGDTGNLKPGQTSKNETQGATAERWKIFSKNEDAGTVTMRLLRDSWCLFKELRLKHWVELVMGMPSLAIEIFESYLNRLGYSLYSFLAQFPQENAKYRSIATVRHLAHYLCRADISQAIRPTDRFLYATIVNAVERAEKKKPFFKMDLDAPFLTAPLKSLLSRPDKDILRRLSILETRYKRYRAGAEMAQGQEFYTDTKLFTLLSEESVVAVARKITRDTLMNFLKISYDGILTSDCHLKGLATEWNCFFFESEELSAFGGLNSSLSALAKELYYLRNFFSLSALLSGMCQAGIELEHEFAEFIDSGSNHRRYRLKFHMEPSLPFLYPFIRDLKRGKFTAVNGIFSFLLYGQFLERLIG